MGEKNKKKDNKNLKSGITAMVCLIIMVGIICFIITTTPSPPNPNPTNGTDTNTTDTNTATEPTDAEFLKQIANEEWCYKQYLHRRPILYINAINNETGKQTKYRLQEAKDLNLVQDGIGLEIYMENIDKTGVLCGHYLYFDFRNLYTMCLQIPENDLNREKCLQTDTLDMDKWVQYIYDNNLSGDWNATDVK